MHGSHSVHITVFYTTPEELRMVPVANQKKRASNFAPHDLERKLETSDQKSVTVSHTAPTLSQGEPVLRVNKVCLFVTRRASCALPCLVRCVVLCCVASCRVSCVAWSRHVSYALSCVVAFVVSRRRVVSCRVSCIVWFVWWCVFVVSCVSVARV